MTIVESKSFVKQSLDRVFVRRSASLPALLLAGFLSVLFAPGAGAQGSGCAACKVGDARVTLTGSGTVDDSSVVLTVTISALSKPITVKPDQSATGGSLRVVLPPVELDLSYEDEITVVVSGSRAGSGDIFPGTESFSINAQVCGGTIEIISPDPNAPENNSSMLWDEPKLGQTYPLRVHGARGDSSRGGRGNEDVDAGGQEGTTAGSYEQQPAGMNVSRSMGLLSDGTMAGNLALKGNGDDITKSPIALVTFLTAYYRNESPDNLGISGKESVWEESSGNTRTYWRLDPGGGSTAPPKSKLAQVTIDSDNKLVIGFFDSNESEFQTTTIERVNSDLKVTDTGPALATSVVVLSADNSGGSAGANWGKSESGVTTNVTSAISGNRRIVTTTTTENGVPTQQIERFRIIGGRELLDKSTLYSNQPPEDQEITFHDYYDDPNDVHNYAQLKYVKHPDGGWTAYHRFMTTAAAGDPGPLGQPMFVERTFEPWLEGPAGPVDDPATYDPGAFIGKITEHHYTHAIYEDDTYNRLAGVIEKVNGAVVSRTHYEESDVEVVTDQYVSATKFLRSKITRYAFYDEDEFLRNRIKERYGPVEITVGASAPDINDYLVEAYAYPNDDLTETTIDEHPAEPEKTTRRVVYSNVLGQTTKEETLICETGGSTPSYHATPATVTEYFYDDLGRPTETKRDGVVTSETVYVSPTETHHISADGTRTITVTHAVTGETVSTKREGGPVTTYPDEELVKTTEAGGTDYLQSRTVTTNGEITLTEDENGLVTTYAYGQAPSSYGGRQTTATLPGTGTITTYYYRDGKTARVIGTGTNDAMEYGYTIDPTTGFLTTRICRCPSIFQQQFWTSTTTDWAGRVVNTKKPGVNSGVVTEEHHYDIRGRLVRVSTQNAGVAVADRISEYDARGRAEYSGYDLDSSGGLQWGSDQMTGSQTRYELIEGQWWEVVETEGHHQNSGPVVLSRVRRRMAPVADYDGEAGTHLLSEVITTSATELMTRQVELVTPTGQTRVVKNYIKQSTVATDWNLRSTRVITGGLLRREIAPLRNTYYAYDGLDRLIEVKQTSRSDTNVDGDGLYQFRREIYTYKTLGGDRTSRLMAGRTLQQQSDDPTQAGEGVATSYQYYGNGVTGAGRVKSLTTGTQTTYYAYDQAGNPTHQWGGSYPVQYVYDGVGRLEEMITYRGSDQLGPAPTETAALPAYFSGNGDKTTWSYDAGTGALLSKTDAWNRSVDYTYAANGWLLTRTWERHTNGNSGLRVRATYTHDPLGRVKTVGYNDGTPGRTYDYYLSGELERATRDGSGDTEYQYHADGTLKKEIQGGVANRSEYQYELGELGLIETTAGNQALSDVDYDVRITGLMAVTHDDWKVKIDPVKYDDTSDVRQRVLDYDNTASPGGEMKALFSYRTDGLLHEVDYQGTDLPDLDTGYTYNAEGRRDAMTFADGKWVFEYNSRGEVSKTAKFIRGDETKVLPGYQRLYDYDGIGNRWEVFEGGEDTLWNSVDMNRLSYGWVSGGTQTIGATAVNTYPYLTRGPYYFYGVVGYSDDATSTLQLEEQNWPNGTTWQHILSGTTRVDNYFHIESRAYFDAEYHKLRVTSGTEPPIYEEEFVPDDVEAPAYDHDGNLIKDERWEYEWDAENRLVRIETKASLVGTPQIAPHEILEFKYDHVGRRIEKTYRDLDAEANSDYGRNYRERFVYSGWNPVATLRGAGTGAGQYATPTLYQSYVWGHDLSGSMDGAGGVGGLLLLRHHAGPEAGVYYPCYDGNGNILRLVRETGGDLSIAAIYEYDAFGRLVRGSGPMKELNPFRFSTKFTDIETGLVYYGLRYYNPVHGRFINRDPIGEEGGLNLYGFVGNDAVNNWDYLGLKWKIERKNKEYAIATAESSDTLANLAKQIGFNENEASEWLRDINGNKWLQSMDMFGSVSAFGKGCSFRIPNTILSRSEHGMFYNYFIVDTNLETLRSHGYKVKHKEIRRSHLGKYSLELKQLSDKGSLAGIYLDAHGQAGYWYIGDKAPQITFESMKHHLRYKLSFGYFATCESGWSGEDDPVRYRDYSRFPKSGFCRRSDWSKYNSVDSPPSVDPSSPRRKSKKKKVEDYSPQAPIGAGAPDLMSDNPLLYHGVKRTYWPGFDDLRLIFD